VRVRLLNLLTVLSLLLFLPLVAQAGRSLIRDVGRFHLDAKGDKLLGVDAHNIRVQWREEADHSRWRYFADNEVDRSAEVQTWWVVLVVGALPAVRVLRVVRRYKTLRRVNAGLCLRCGYDLRATPGRCPECGTAPAPQETVAPPPPAR